MILPRMSRSFILFHTSPICPSGTVRKITSLYSHSCSRLSYTQVSVNCAASSALCLLVLKYPPTSRHNAPSVFSLTSPLFSAIYLPNVNPTFPAPINPILIQSPAKICCQYPCMRFLWKHDPGTASFEYHPSNILTFHFLIVKLVLKLFYYFFVSFHGSLFHISALVLKL